MKENEPLFAKREKVFFHWLSNQVTNNQLSDLYMVLNTINEYGKMMNWFQQTLFELGDLEHAANFQKMVKNDKRFQFVHYKEVKQILFFLQKYCEFFGENKKGTDQTTETITELKPIAVEKKKGSIKLRTKKGTVYYGESPAEVLAALCGKLAQFYPETFNSLIGAQYSTHGSVVLLVEEPRHGGVKVNNTECYIDKNLGKDAVIPYGKWLCKMCGENNWPESLSVPADLPLDKQKLPHKETVEAIKKQPTDVIIEVESLKASSCKKWSNYEIALLIEAYQKIKKQEDIQPIAKQLSKRLRDYAEKNGKEIDSTYRNTNGIIMQLGTVQYCFTDGMKGFSNASNQTREMVKMYKLSRAEFNKILNEAHRIIEQSGSNEISELLAGEEYMLLRNKLIEQGITSLQQLKTMDLWQFMNRFSLYSISRRQEVYKQTRSLIISQNETNRKKQYCIKTNKGNNYYGSTPSEAFAEFCEMIALKYPIKIRNLINQKYHNVGPIILFATPPTNDSLQLSNPKVYIDENLGMAQAEFYSKWLCEKCGEVEIPLSITTTEHLTEKAKAENKDDSTQKQDLKENDEQLQIIDETEEKEKINKQDDETRKDWITNMLSSLNIDYIDKRENQGCLWISGGHELDQFIKACKQKGYRLNYKADGYKGLKRGPAWWTVDVINSQKQDKSINSQKKEEEKQNILPKRIKETLPPSEFRSWLEKGFRAYLTKKKGYADKTVSQYCYSIDAIEQFLETNHLHLTLIDIDANEAKEVSRQLSANRKFIEWNRKDHYQYSAALGQYLTFLDSDFYISKFIIPNQKSNNSSYETRKPNYKEKEDSLSKNMTVKDAVIEVLSKTKAPMSAADIYIEIEARHLYSFNSNNARMIVDHAIRRSCIGIYLPDSTKEKIFSRVFDSKGISQYYLIDEAKIKQDEKVKLKTEASYPNIETEAKIETKPEPKSIPEGVSLVFPYTQKQAAKIIFEADLDGIKTDTLADRLNMSVAATKKIICDDINIIEIEGKLIHKDAFVDWDQAADQLVSILGKLMEKNNGYVSRSQLYDYARANMQMFMNDNDMDDAQKIYDMAVHLFAKEKYHGVEYSFSNLQHISKLQTGLSSVLDVILNYAREQGGFFNEEDLNSYLESVKIKTGNLRNGIMHVYDKPTFLFYAYHVFVLSECLRINDEWLNAVKKALDRLFADMGDHVILRDIQPIWYAQLPSLPGDRPWTGILLQSVLLHYGKKLGSAKTIYAYQSLSGDYLQSMLVSSESEIQSFNDAVIAVLVENEIKQREFESGELRQILIDRGLIGSTDLIGGLSKYITSDERFVWSSKGQRVSIKI